MRINWEGRYALVLQDTDYGSDLLWYGRVLNHGPWGVRLRAHGWWPEGQFSEVGSPCDLVATVLRPDVMWFEPLAEPLPRV